MYLADLQQTLLIPFLGPDGPGMDAHVEPLSIDATLAGRAYQHVEAFVQGDAAGTSTVWLPLLDGSERLGVIAISVDGDAESLLGGRTGSTLRRFVSIFGELVMTKTLYGDTIVRLRRVAQMGLAAEMQWSLLPPLTFVCPEVTIAAALEPAYEVAGDTFDYAIDDGRGALRRARRNGARVSQRAVGGGGRGRLPPRPPRRPLAAGCVRARSTTRSARRSAARCSPRPSSRSWIRAPGSCGG